MYETVSDSVSSTVGISEAIVSSACCICAATSSYASGPPGTGDSFWVTLLSVIIVLLFPWARFCRARPHFFCPGEAGRSPSRHPFRAQPLLRPPDPYAFASAEPSWKPEADLKTGAIEPIPVDFHPK